MTQRMKNIIARADKEAATANGKALADRATKAVSDALAELAPQASVPTDDDFQRVAQQVTQPVLAQGLLQNGWLTALHDGQPLPDGTDALARMHFPGLCDPLDLPNPIKVVEMRSLAVALAACLGAVLGFVIALTFGPLFFRLVYGGSELRGLLVFGLVISLILCPAGAFGMVWAAWEVWKRPRLQTFVQLSLGGAAVADLWLMFRGPGAWSTIWRALRGGNRYAGRWGRVHRVLAFVAIILLLELGAPKVTYATDEFRKQLRKTIDQWLRHHVRLLAVLIADEAASDASGAPGDDQEEKITELKSRIAALLKPIHALNEAVQDDVTDADIRDLVKELLGVAAIAIGPMPERPKTLIWSREYDTKYTVFGLPVQEGDLVKVEEWPVEVDGKVEAKGTVRKIGVA